MTNYSNSPADREHRTLYRSDAVLPDLYRFRWVRASVLSAGRFVTLLGEEIIPTYSNQNFNETRGFVFNLGEPLTHTGVRASYTLTIMLRRPAGSTTDGIPEPASTMAVPTAKANLP